MGDSRRFSLFADLIASNWPASRFVCDVAGGKGYLQAALYGHGFRNVISWDKRPKYSKGLRAKHYRYGYFDYRSAPIDYELVVGMHPDQGTDHIVSYAVKHRVPFAICPCCILPSAQAYFYPSNSYKHWCDHLAGLAERAGFRVTATSLPMAGRNEVLLGWPE